MKRDLLDILRCPECKGELELTSPESDGSSDEGSPQEIEEGTLYCKECDIEYPIDEGIPNMLPPED
ncbi:MAG: methytransferase partner Trm112 [Candidatus Thermoplasmatota archaeon]